MNSPPPGSRIMVGMSGGVDSSVAALLLRDQGYAVTGVFMKNWNEDDGTEYCTAKEDLFDALRVCDRLGIELETVNFAAQYWDRVFAHFLAEYRAGRTPNPDVLCNREIKFKVFLDYCHRLGARRIATGHYARTGRDADGQTLLLRARDANKDQSYFLYAVSPLAIAQTLFPLGELDKPRVRQLARRAGLITHDKRDSTGICFIGERRFADFLKNYLPARPGPIATPDGRVLGEHQGLMYYTIGQRAGLRIGGIRGAGAQPWYVAAKELETGTLVVVQGDDSPLLHWHGLLAEQLHWIPHPPHQTRFACTAKTRYRQPDQHCVVELDGDRCQVQFTTPQRAITPGQSVVFYAGERCLGGGVITAGIR
jgi:tRNA-uridine 2-sulfurtransferase